MRRSAATASVDEIVKHLRLPVWPAWFGIVYIVLDLITGKPELGAALEDRFGGRVCPMLLDKTQSDPFLLVAHHRHSFNVVDPFRYVFRMLLPEGFPAHPHRGFETVTYVLRGGLVHRDSYGVKKSYGAPDFADGSGEGAAVQWMTAGFGLKHEEMWRTGGALDSTDQELYQIWVNLPAKAKLVAPKMQMLGGHDAPADKPPQPTADGAAAWGRDVQVRELGPVPKSAPVDFPGVTVRVVSGEAAGVHSPVETYSDVAILHVTMEPGATWAWPRPAFWTCLVYVRRGEVAIGDPGTPLPVHNTATLGRRGAPDTVELQAGDGGADVLILAGMPLGQHVEMAANIVMNTPREVAEANRDVERGLFGPTWSHEVDDEAWRAEVAGHWAWMQKWRQQAGF